jgi:GDPmannose 4,6-dehydratase
MTKTKKVLITGVTGQDGSILAKNLFDQGYEVYGGFRRAAQNSWRMRELGLLQSINFVNYESADPTTIDFLLAAHEFDYIYHFAGSSFTVDSLAFPQNTLLTNINGTVALLEGVKKFSPRTRVFVAGSSEIFKRPSSNTKVILDEDSPRGPLNPYGVSHLAIESLVSIYRKIHGLRVSLGIFFNHESSFRSLQFVSRKISFGIASIKMNGAEPIHLGNFSSGRDWGSAEDFMNGVQLLNESEINDDFIFSTGRFSTVRELLYNASVAAGFSPIFTGEGLNEVCRDEKSERLLAVSDLKFYRNTDLGEYVGDSSKLAKAFDWYSGKKIETIMEEMTLRDIFRVTHFS